ncbi:MAG: hypothetical protein ACYTDT_04870 [Planctomycetota bacterium]|jgi:hypothetical protein
MFSKSVYTSFPRPSRSVWSCLLVLCALTLLACRSIPDDTLIENNNEKDSAQYTELVSQAEEYMARTPRTIKSVRLAQRRYRSAININNTEYTTLVAAAKVNAWLAEFLENDDQREEHAKTGLLLANTALKIDPKGAEAIFFHGVLSGFLADADVTYGLDAVKKIEADMKSLIEREEWLEHAGALRVYGTLLLRAPGPPTSIGSLRKAKRNLTRALEIDPDWPENQLYMAELELELADENDDVALAESARDRLDTYLIGANAKAPTGNEYEFKHWQKLARELLEEYAD